LDFLGVKQLLFFGTIDGLNLFECWKEDEKRSEEQEQEQEQEQEGKTYCARIEYSFW
jgi:hypothetical protein